MECSEVNSKKTGLSVNSKGIRKQKKKRSSKLFLIKKMEKLEESPVVDPLIKPVPESGLESMIQDIKIDNICSSKTE